MFPRRVPHRCLASQGSSTANAGAGRGGDNCNHFGRARKSSTNLLPDEVPNSWVALGRGAEQINGVAVEVKYRLANASSGQR